MYYPQEPFAGFQDKEFYSKLDLDTLFYIFYYHANTYEQCVPPRSLLKEPKAKLTIIGFDSTQVVGCARAQEAELAVS